MEPLELTEPRLWRGLTEAQVVRQFFQFVHEGADGKELMRAVLPNLCGLEDMLEERGK